MKKITLVFLMATSLLACKSNTKDVAKSDSTTAANAVQEAKSEDWVAVDSATAMQKMMEAGTPGKEQAMLAKFDGAWNAETTMWMSADSPPMVSKANATNKMMFGGRYQQMSFVGNMMGQAFEGLSTTGYDNARKTWVSTWIDNMSTGIMTMEGSWDEASKTFTYSGKMLCPANGKNCDMKEILRIVDDKTQVIEMYGPDLKTGKSYKNMEIKLTRK